LQVIKIYLLQVNIQFSDHVRIFSYISLFLIATLLAILLLGVSF
jgi:hypothetical protein